MHSRRLLRTALLAVALVVPAACSSSSSGTAASTSAPSTSAADSTAPTTSEATGTTTGGGGGGDTTTTKPASGPNTTKPAATGAQITMSVTNPPSCPAPGVTFQFEPTITISWTVTNADSVTIAIDSPDPFEPGLPLSGSMVRPWSCDNSAHTYYVQAVKNGQVVAQKSKTVNPST